MLSLKQGKKGEWCLLRDRDTLLLNEQPHNATLHLNGLGKICQPSCQYHCLGPNFINAFLWGSPKKIRSTSNCGDKCSKELCLPSSLDNKKIDVNLVANNFLNNGLESWNAMGNCSSKILTRDQGLSVPQHKDPLSIYMCQL